MSKAKQARRRQIKAAIAQGKGRYILRRGLINWGIPFFLLFLLLATAGNALILKKPFGEAFTGLFPFTFLLGLLTFGSGGYFVGRHHWRLLLKEAGPKYSKE